MFSGGDANVGMSLGMYGPPMGEPNCAAGLENNHPLCQNLSRESDSPREPVEGSVPLGMAFLAEAHAKFFVGLGMLSGKISLQRSDASGLAYFGSFSGLADVFLASDAMHGKKPHNLVRSVCVVAPLALSSAGFVDAFSRDGNLPTDIALIGGGLLSSLFALAAPDWAVRPVPTAGGLALAGSW